jgi:hypothetical protein
MLSLDCSAPEIIPDAHEHAETHKSNRIVLLWEHHQVPKQVVGRTVGRSFESMPLIGTDRNSIST